MTWLGLAPDPAAAREPAIARHYDHVLLVSIDGMHAVDLTNWVEHHPDSNLARLSQTGLTYPNAFTTAPSDSYPGITAQVTGASPRTAGLFYDDSYDRTAYPSKAFYTSRGLPDPGCTGTPGAELTNHEALDKTYDFSSGVVADITGGGTLGQVYTQLDPDHMQRRLVDGDCRPMYPHEYMRTNTVFEVIKAAGGLTAWSDKHPAYENLSGPSGKGIDDLFAPEINAQMVLPGAPAGQDNTTSFAAVRAYDSIKVNAVLNWIDGYNSTRTAQPGVPAIFGMNFQAVSVGQKLATAGFGDDPSLTGGYLDGNATPGNALTQQFQFVDDALGRFVKELAAQGLDKSTLIIVSAKHGQSPIDPKARVTQSDAPFQATPGFGDHGFEICDDAGLIWLQPDLQKANYDAAKAYLLANAAKLHIAQLLDRESLTPLYGDPFTNSRVPDFIAVTDHGVICTGGSKLAEHGGLSDDDRNVLLLVSAPDVAPAVVEGLTYTTQIAPTILSALGLDPRKLKGVREEGTQVLGR
ncbi:MAG TPA: alkaline phosphatase family protein [Rhodopila sp.]|nr:alkaline phosphatase family protein [Rhodopila sp.]